MSLDKICRLCLESCQENSHQVLENGIQNKIMLCLNLEIQPNDTMPKKICKNCRFQLEKSYVFRISSKASERKLRKHIRLLNAGKESVLKPGIDPDENDDEICDFNQMMLESFVSCFTM
jgi:hypothetical protein